MAAGGGGGGHLRGCREKGMLVFPPAKMLPSLLLFVASCVTYITSSLILKLLSPLLRSADGFLPMIT